MAQLDTKQYDALERAIIQRSRIAVYRRGTEFIVVPTSLTLRDGREVIHAMHPTTGDSLALFLDELDAFEVVR
jgi:hypothetical protein